MGIVDYLLIGGIVLAMGFALRVCIRKKGKSCGCDCGNCSGNCKK